MRDVVASPYRGHYESGESVFYFSIPVALLAAVALGITSHLKHECSYTTVHIVGNKIVGHTKTCSWKLK